jgi:hypothetical protein
MYDDAIEMSLAMERRVRTDDRRAPRPDPDFAAYHASPRIRATLDTRSHTQRSFSLSSLFRVRRHDVFCLPPRKGLGRVLDRDVRFVML